ncbi:MAG: hypothetical protein QOI40_2113, partial [Alphaproteobacteria bacterium]|nr:hypothetical protein [Alphaproteobacteria bacterium]
MNRPFTVIAVVLLAASLASHVCAQG